MSECVFKNGKPNGRDFSYKEFYDRYGCKCSLQESSLVDPSIWLGLKKHNLKNLKRSSLLLIHVCNLVINKLKNLLLIYNLSWRNIDNA